MADSPRRLILRATLKLLVLAALLIVAAALLHDNGEEEGDAPALPALQFDLSSLQAGQPLRLEWRGGPLQLLRMDKSGPLYLFYDRGGSLGCPLSWQPANTHPAPLQPWPGGFRDQCSGIWYRYDGRVVPGQALEQDLQPAPYRLQGENLLEVGVNGDNAAPATTP